MTGACTVNSPGSGLKQVSDCCEHDNELTGSTKYWGYLEWLRDCWLLKKNSVETGVELTNVVSPSCAEQHLYECSRFMNRKSGYSINTGQEKLQK